MNNDKREIPFSEVAQQVDGVTTAADQYRANAIDRLLVARGARETGLTREEARLSKKLGADHPRVVTLANRRAGNAGLRRDLELESVRAHTDIPKVGEHDWALGGIVRDARLRPFPGATVALYDTSGRWVHELGYACSDANGRFRIDVKNVRQFDTSVFARVTSADGAVLAQDRAPLTPAGGAFDYREITVSEEARPCPPPGEPSAPPPPAPAPDAWVVRGRVTDAKGNGLGGLTVNLYDKDLIFDDRLGQTKTDERGDYVLVYRTEDFRDLIERKPDIYIKVLDASGATLYSSKRAIRYESGRIETIDARIER